MTHRFLVRPRRQAGFTLLELLVVLVLMGVILAIAVLSMGDGGRSDRIREGARRVVALVDLAEEEALLNTAVYGLELREQGYRFVNFHEGRWQALAQDSLLGAREWPIGVEAQLYLEEQPVALSQEPSGKGDEEPQPALLFYPDGERTPFVLELSYPQPPHLRQRITGALFGPLTLESVEEGAW